MSSSKQKQMATDRQIRVVKHIMAYGTPMTEREIEHVENGTLTFKKARAIIRRWDHRRPDRSDPMVRITVRVNRPSDPLWRNDPEWIDGARQFHFHMTLADAASMIGKSLRMGRVITRAATY